MIYMVCYKCGIGSTRKNFLTIVNGSLQHYGGCV
jgi:hypothetical protein